jgi:hypothetical protein
MAYRHGRSKRRLGRPRKPRFRTVELDDKGRPLHDLDYESEKYKGAVTHAAEGLLAQRKARAASEMASDLEETVNKANRLVAEASMLVEHVVRMISKRRKANEEL